MYFCLQLVSSCLPLIFSGFKIILKCLFPNDSPSIVSDPVTPSQQTLLQQGLTQMKGFPHNYSKLMFLFYLRTLGGGGVFKKQLLVKVPFNDNDGLSFLIGAPLKDGKMSPCKLQPSPEYSTEN